MERQSASRGEMPFLDHLEELRWRVFKAAAALVIGSLLGLWLIVEFDVLALLVNPARPYIPDGKLIYTNPMTPFFFIMKTSVITGIIFAFPILVYQVWAFLSPALEDREKRLIVPSLYLGFALFAWGVDIAYQYALPITLRFMTGLQTELLQPFFTADEYLSFTVRLLLSFGIFFELPVVVLVLSALGLVTPGFLRSKRRHAVVIITILASLLSPGDALMVTLLLIVPLLFLYEFSILLSVLVWRQKRLDEKKYSIGDPDRAAPPEGTVGREESSEPGTTSPPDSQEPGPSGEEEPDR